MILCRTPFRVSFFGGGTDFPQWYLENGGAVISTSINKYSYITVRTLPDIFNYRYRLRYFKTEEVKNINEIKHPTFREALKKHFLKNKTIEIVHNADLPAMTGLGSSSSTAVGTIHALSFFNKKKLNKLDLALDAIDIEQNILKENVGSQDQIAASFGGFNYIQFNRNRIKVNKILNIKNVEKIEKSILLVFSGTQRKANNIERDKIKNLKKNYNYLNLMNQLTLEARSILLSNKFTIEEFGKLLDHQWEIKKKLSSMVSNPKINDIYELGIQNGAYGAKLLGAGHGGFIVFICNENVKNRIKEKLKNFFNISIKFENSGSKIIYKEN
jgi:D-glycero-alpha-D-manno-heptose-7-phosphate kinase